jgi:hypothetical protein
MIFACVPSENVYGYEQIILHALCLIDIETPLVMQYRIGNPSMGLEPPKGSCTTLATTGAMFALYTESPTSIARRRKKALEYLPHMRPDTFEELYAAKTVCYGSASRTIVPNWLPLPLYCNKGFEL